ncbi:hypothetical protein [Micromonospora sp. URMC 103]|jgi:hypothetical protein|uniref:hypothetical protein n=1 Tax=Micromonospora sp. URMC 103 TaxID=3423406 RepID=UPI003F1AB2DB
MERLPAGFSAVDQTQAVAEVIEARIWGGIHTRTADTEGAKVGAAVTAYMIENYFRPRP